MNDGNHPGPTHGEKMACFQQLCLRLRQNDPTLELIECRRSSRFQDDEFTLDYNDEDFIRFGQALAGNTNVKSFKMLDGNWNRVTSRGARSLADGICRSHCEKLQYRGTSQREEHDENPTIIPKELYGGIYQSTTIHHLEISNTVVHAPALVMLLSPPSSFESFTLKSLILWACPLSSNSMGVLAVGLRNNKFLQTLNLSGCQIDDAGVTALSEYLQDNTLLVALELSFNQIGPIGAQRLMRTISKHPVLWKLNLDANPDLAVGGFEVIGAQLPHLGVGVLQAGCYRPRNDRDSMISDEACQALADGLRQNVTLRELCLQCNSLSARGVHAIVRGLTKHPTARKLGLTYNSTIGIEGIQLIGQELGNLLLEELNLSFCMSERRSETNNNDARNQAFQLLAMGLRSNSSLQVLNFSGNDLRPLEAQILMQSVANHQSMRKLIINGHSKIGFEGLTLMANELPNCGLEEISLRDFHPWNVGLEEKEVAMKAGRALVDGMKRNSHLGRLDIRVCTGLGQMKPLIQNYLEEVEVYLSLNRSGRYLVMRTDYGDVPSGLWGNVLELSNNKIHHMYYFLRELPWLVPSNPSRN